MLLCGMSKRLTHEEIIFRLGEVHGGRYDYSLLEYTTSKDRIKIICREHGEFQQVYSTHAAGHGCPTCAKIERGNRARITYDEFIEKARELYGDLYIYPARGSYTKASDKITITCTKHGDFVTTPTRHINSASGCSGCSLARTGRVALTEEEFFRRVKKAHGDRYDLSKTVFSGSKTPVVVTCKIHGEFSTKPHNFSKGTNCPKCARIEASLKTRKGTAYFVAKFREVHGDKYTYPERVDSINKIEITCTEHGVFLQNVHDHIRGHGCPRCFYDDTGTAFTYEEFWKKHGRDGYIMKGFTKAVEPATITCLEHGLTYETTPHDFAVSPGGRCPQCANVSSPHRAVLNMFPNEAVEVNSRNIIKPYELDVYYPEHRLAVEVNGLYFHSTAKLESPIYHERKFRDCEEKGVQLIQIWDSEIRDKPGLVRSLIANKLGLTTEKVYARSCDIKDIDNKTYREFLEQNHLEGGVDSSHRKALFHDGEIVAVMGLRQNLLQRFCSRINLNVVGGFSRLLKAFDLTQVVTYSDNRYSDGSLYKNHGFEYGGKTSTRMHVTDGTNLYSRWGFQRKNLTTYPGYSDDKTAEEILNENGLYYIYAPGTRKWIWKNPSR